MILDVMLPKMTGLEICKIAPRRGLSTCPSSCSPRAARRSTRCSASSSAPTTTSPSRSASWSCWPGSMRSSGVRRSARRSRQRRRPRVRTLHRSISTTTSRRKDGVELDLTPREFRLLGHFIEHRGEVVTREELLDTVWGYDTIPFTRTVDTHIAKLRKKIEDNPSDPRLIVTVHRLGYKFIG